MITKFKIYEAINQGKPKVGDYVILNYSETNTNDIKKSLFIDNSVGKIFRKEEEFFYVRYYNIPEEILKDFKYSDYSDGIRVGNSVFIHTDDILYWSEDKEELEVILTAKKYNL